MALNYRPREEGTLDNLLRAMRAGLDPQLGYSLFSGVSSAAQSRAAAARAAQQAKQAGRRDTLSGLVEALIAQASGRLPYAGASTLVNALGNLPGVGPGMERRLGATLGDLYPTVTTTPEQPTPTGTGPGLQNLLQTVTGPSEFSPLYQQPAADPLAALGQASDIASLVAAGVPGQAISSVVPQQGPLAGFLQGLFPGGYGEPSSLAQAGAPIFDQPTAAGISGDIATLLGLDPTTGEKAAAPPVNPATGNIYGLHEARMKIMANLRLLGYSESDLAKAFDYIEQVWKSLGGPMPIMSYPLAQNIVGSFTPAQQQTMRAAQRQIEQTLR